MLPNPTIVPCPYTSNRTTKEALATTLLNFQTRVASNHVTYVTALKTNLPSFKEKYKEIDDLGLKWDLIKMEIRGFTLQYSKRKARKYRDQEKSLCKKSKRSPSKC